MAAHGLNLKRLLIAPKAQNLSLTALAIDTELPSLKRFIGNPYQSQTAVSVAKK